ncbi:hypothetical protein [Pelagerythrobacter aerophilus]|uniref:DNA transfer protein p32 n=1 Tax=Pelagerythrobacter aerophilus TaxID=2306995 RepID=A0A418NDJ7_9SPHN|nr:hypothetical protein [Pelagerythrobacter aerophilus]RIV75623.1 hypothetical protein D2V04_15125 [Pelagerythrobacter aerophilus]
MPLGAVVGAGVIGAGASVIGANKNSKAINKATDAQTAANDKAIAAQEKARSENLALQRPIYDAGLPAMGARNALLGLGGTAPQAANTNTTNALAQYQGANPDTSGTRTMRGPTGWNALDNALERQGYFRPQTPGPISGYGGGTWNADGTQATPAGQTPQEAAEDAFDVFRNSTGYQFRIDQGQDALNSGFAGSGLLRSGAALKALDDYRQGMATAEFGNYWNMLGEQQNLTAGAANAMSGVNTNYANNAGNLAMSQGNALANAAVAQANNSNAMWGNIANSVGSGVGILAGMGKL